MSETTNVSPGRQIANAIGRLWWMPLVRGVLLMILGGYALFHPGMTVIVLTQVVGIFVIADGVLAVLAGILGTTPSRGWTIVRGIILILVGVFVFVHAVAIAGITATIVLYIIAIGAIISGVLEIVGAIRDREGLEGEGWLMLAGTLAILFGLLLLVAPLAFGMLIVAILGAYAIFYGLSLIVWAFRVRKFGRDLREATP
jgi:uncharacterized membrane protein HdeD (DUF308 family)